MLCQSHRAYGRKRQEVACRCRFGFTQFCCSLGYECLTWTLTQIMAKNLQKDATRSLRYVVLLGSTYCSSLQVAAAPLNRRLNLPEAATAEAAEVISGFQGIFAMTTMLFEMPADWVAMVPGVTHYQESARLMRRFVM